MSNHYYKINKIKAREVLDSRGNPTIETTVCAGELCARAIAPSGASTGSAEAFEMRDRDSSHYNGLGVLRAVENVNKIIAPQLIDFDPTNQKLIDQTMINIDGTENKSSLGANAILSVSLAASKLAAKVIGIPLWKYIGGTLSDTLPVPMMNIINGGKHANNSINCQEFMIMPTGAPNFQSALEWSVKVYNALKTILKSNGLSTTVGDEGGFAPELRDDEEALIYITRAIEKAGFTPGVDFFIALDPATTEMYEEARKKDQSGNYYFWKSDKLFTPTAMIELWTNWVQKYPIASIEDAMAEEDWDGWRTLSDTLGGKIQLVGDDLFVTNKKRLAYGIENKISNAILIKPNQIGTLTETLETIKLAKDSGFGCIVSHRSGETEDTFIADLAVGVNSKQIKTGAPCRTDRVAKYNQLLRIEEELANHGRYPGPEIFKRFGKI